MRDWTVIRERYLRDALPIRLGGLAANLARVKSFSRHPANRDLVESLLEESKFFIEWTAPQAEIALAAELVDLQVQLARWQRKWSEIWEDLELRTAVAERAGAWSERVLHRSGLLQGDGPSSSRVLPPADAAGFLGIR